MQALSVRQISVSDMSSKKKYILPAVLYALLACGLVIGALYDYQISKTLTSFNDSWAYFLEKWAEPPSLLFVGFVFSALSICIVSENKKGKYYLAILCFICGCAINSVTCVRTAEYYGIEGYTPLCIAIGVVFSVIFTIASTKIDTELLIKAKNAFICVVAIALATLVIISVVKSLWGRMRFRELTDISDFTKWYIPVGKAADDAHKSFPSGHTSNAVMLYGIVLILETMGKKLASQVAKYLCIVWIAIVMLSRIACGAHFLSDTCMGAMITMTIVIVCRTFIIDRSRKNINGK